MWNKKIYILEVVRRMQNVKREDVYKRQVHYRTEDQKDQRPTGISHTTQDAAAHIIDHIADRSEKNDGQVGSGIF